MRYIVNGCGLHGYQPREGECLSKLKNVREVTITTQEQGLRQIKAWKYTAEVYENDV